MSVENTWDSQSVAINTGAIDWMKKRDESSEGVWLGWKDLSVEVDVSQGLFKKKEKKVIVHGSRGVARPGEVLGVFGPSGAGKTSLFNALAKRGRGYRVKGSLTLNGQPYDKSELKKVAGFVFQEPLFRAFMTTEEALRTAAILKLPGDMSHADKEERVQALLDAFDLRKCAKTKIGDSRVKGISGGEKKRLSIAIELLTGPSLLFLDEPTTGLDAASSLSVVKLLADLADNGTTVVTVLHQPRAAILAYVDRFLILSDGRDVFYGNLQQMISFFDYLDMPIPLRTNPLDYVLDVINTNEQLFEMLRGQDKKDSSSAFAKLLRGARASSTKRSRRRGATGTTTVASSANRVAVDRKELAKYLSDKYRESNIFDEETKSVPDVYEPLSQEAVKGSRFIDRLGGLLVREFKNRLRSPDVYMGQLIAIVVSGLVMGSVYYQLPPTAIFNRFTAVSFGVLCSVFISFNLVLRIPVDRLVWLQDYDNGMYGAIEYYLSVTLSGMVAEVVFSIVLSTIFYWMCGLRATAAAFFIYVGFNVLASVTAGAMMYFSGSVAPTPSAANSITTILLLFVLVLNGYFITYSTIPVYWRWVSTVNYMRFAVTAVVWNEFHNQTYNCTGQQACTTTSGDVLLISRGVDPNLDLWLMAIYILIVFFIFHILAMLAVMFCYTGRVYELKLVRWIMGKSEERRQRKEEEEKELKSLP